MKKSSIVVETLFPTTEFCVDLKLNKCKKGRMKVGENLNGNIARDGEDHYTFTEMTSEKKTTHRNPFVYGGVWVNIKQDKNGMLYATFNRPDYVGNYSFKQYGKNAGEELIAIATLLESQGVE